MKKIHKWKKTDIGWTVGYDELCMYPMMPDGTHILDLDDNEWQKFPDFGPFEEWTITYKGELYIVLPD